MGIFRSNKNHIPTPWYRLDNAAKIYPAVTTVNRTSVFRIGVELTDVVKIVELQKAVDLTLDELPYFSSQLKKGFFWYWLEPSSSKPRIQLDHSPPCRTFLLERSNHLLMRVLAKENRISVEFMHVLTDGGGAMEFFKQMMRNYALGCGWTDKVVEIDQLPNRKPKDFYLDAYQLHFDKALPKPQKLSKAYHLPFVVKRNPIFKTSHLEFPVKQCIQKAKEYKVSLTEFLAAGYLFVLQTIFLEEKKNKKKKSRKTVLRVQVPVNLRKIFHSDTLRNFALFVMPEIDMRFGEYSFQEISSLVHHYMRLETDKRQIQRIITRNVGGEKNYIVRALPLFLKVPTLYFAYKFSGPKLYSGVLTNLGQVNLDEYCEPHVKRCVFIAPPPDPSIRLNSALITYKDKIIISFGSQSTDTRFEKEFIRFLKQQDINSKLIKFSV